MSSPWWQRLPHGVPHLALGALIALVLHFLSCGIFDQGVHFFFHECGGHTVFGWTLGRASVPAIYVTHWGEPRLFLQGLVWLALVGLAVVAWRDEARRPIAIACGVAALVYPLLALTGANEPLVVAGGHLGEIGWGAFFFYRAVRGGWFEDRDRPLYAALGWILWVGNVVLFFQLATNGAWRAWYESVSLADGVENDYVRVAAMLHSTLARVSAFMLLVALVVPPLGAALAWRRSLTS